MSVKIHDGTPIFLSVVVIVTIIFLSTYSMYLDNRMSIDAIKAGLQQCRSGASSIIVWQKECK